MNIHAELEWWTNVAILALNELAEERGEVTINPSGCERWYLKKVGSNCVLEEDVNTKTRTITIKESC